MKIINTDIDSLYIIEPIIFKDNRECFFESYNKAEFFRKGLNYTFVQDNEVVSKKDVLRGMHVNIKHPQAKLVRVLKGKILDVVIDLRKESKTYMKCFSALLSDENKKQLYIPEGMGHGYLAMEDSQIQFKVTTHYTPNDEIAFAWNSEDIYIKWPIKNPIQNNRDKLSKDLAEAWK